MATAADAPPPVTIVQQTDGIVPPMNASPASLGDLIERTLAATVGPVIDAEEWEQGRYHPTPTIIEAAMAPTAATTWRRSRGATPAQST